jgi:outer membrane lipoprotein-sorting protein
MTQPRRKKMWRFLRTHIWRLILLTLFLLPVTARAAEFSALMMLKDGAKTMPGKIYVKDGKMRQEFIDEEGRTVTIVRPDKKVIWIIMLQEKAYMEMAYKNQLPGQFIQIPPDALGKRQVGTETVNGYVADKYEVTVKGGNGVLKQTVWVAQKLQMPVKMVCKEKNFCLEYKSIREGGVAERLFALPPGFQKIATPTGFARKIEKDME